MDVERDRLYAAKRQAEDELLFTVSAQAAAAESGSAGFGFENIVGVAAGERHTSGRPTGQAAVRVYVVVKVDPDKVDPVALVPPAYEGLPTDVVESGEFVAGSQRGRFRPAPVGVSVGHFAGTAGTLGFVGRRDGGLVVVSNNHVLAQENQGKKGEAILQPGPVDGGRPDADAIAELADFLPLDFAGGPTPVDAATAATEAMLVAPQESCLGPLVLEPLEAQAGTIVRKCGRTTALTRGFVADMDATVRVRYPSGAVLLADQLSVKGLDGVLFSDHGDSGSLVVDELTRRPVGLLCAGSLNFTLVTPIGRVLEGLGLSFAT